MELVVDAGIIFTALIGKGVTKEIIFSNSVKLYAPEYIFYELEHHKQRIQNISKLSEPETKFILNQLKEAIVGVPKKKFESSLTKANSLISDKEDTEYLALAISLDIPIWSNDKHFKEQNEAKTFNTNELVETLKSKGHEFSNKV